MRFTQALQGGSLEEAEKLHGELLADLYTIQVGLWLAGLCVPAASPCTSLRSPSLPPRPLPSPSAPPPLSPSLTLPPSQFQMAKLAAQGGAYERERAAHQQRQEQLQASIQQVRLAASCSCMDAAACERRDAGRTLHRRPALRHLHATLPCATPAPLTTRTRTPPSSSQAEADIEARKEELALARTELAHKQEYEAVRKQIMQARAGGRAGWAGGGRERTEQPSCACPQACATSCPLTPRPC